ncbi:hypothetical protein [Phytohalomonas tamaricis]|uniref:hypothetical protein n=1 Tax=Phytohalomonas tamaricis TaxID=2081032 RepID=UPI00374E08CD
MAALCLCLVATSVTLLAPGLITLGIARFLIGIGTALTSAVAPTYMLELYKRKDTRVRRIGWRRAPRWALALTPQSPACLFYRCPA